MTSDPTPHADTPLSRDRVGGSDPVSVHQNWMNLKTDLVWVYEGAVPDEYRQGTWTSEHLSAWLVRRGSLRLTQGGCELNVGAGKWVIPSPEGRRQSFSKDAEILSIRFRCAWPDGQPLFPRGVDHAFSEVKYPELAEATQALTTLAKLYPKSIFIQFAETPLTFGQYAELKGTLWRWLSCLYEAVVHEGAMPTRVVVKDPRIERSLAIINALPLSTHFKEGDIAERSGLSLSQFVRLFRSEIGVTPKHYFDRARVDFARRMVVSESVSIKEVAISTGFIRLSDFSRWFKLQCGNSPRAYVRAAQSQIAL